MLLKKIRLAASLFLTLAFFQNCSSDTSDPRAMPPTSIGSIQTPASEVTPETENETVIPNPVNPAQQFLSCYASNFEIFCTGANLGSSIAQLDMVATFTGGSQFVTISNVIVKNSVNATHYMICPQPGVNGAYGVPGNASDLPCYEHSVCVTAAIDVRTGRSNEVSSISATTCGNGFDATMRKLITIQSLN